MEKCCRKCRQDKPIELFLKNKRRATGYDSICKECYNIDYKEKRKNNPARFAYEKQYRKENKELIKLKTQKRVKENSEKYRERRQQYYFKNKERLNANARQYHKKNAEKIKLKRKEYNDSGRKYQMILQRFKRNPAAKLGERYRAAVHNALQHTTSHKNNKTVYYLGCSMDNYRKYLESLWEPTMNWENYGHGNGKWVIDHIRPLCSFDLNDPKQQLEAFNFTNTRPYWYISNAQKVSQDKKMSIKLVGSGVIPNVSVNPPTG
jgi:hypothetical protein